MADQRRETTSPRVPHHDHGAPTHLPSAVDSPVRADETSSKRSVMPAIHRRTSSADPVPHAAVLSFDNTKAGLQTVDKGRTEALLQEISEGSAFYENERRKAAQRETFVAKLLEKNRIFESSVMTNPALLRPLQHKVDAIEREIEATQRRWGFVFVHMDMDMFYAAVEQKKNPHLKGIPFGVGSTAMLSTTNYVARQYGVRSGMAGFVGKKLCPDLLIVPSDFAAYESEAHVVRDVVRAYDPDFHSMGWDELTMELSGYLAEHFPDAHSIEEKMDAAEVAMQEVRARVTEATQLTASAGIAPNAQLAKMASNYKKPNGQCTLKLTSREAVMNFMSTIKVREVSGIGKSTEAILAGLGVHTMGELYAQRYRLHYLLTEKTYQFLLAASLGLGGYLDDGYFGAKERRHAAPDPFDAGRASIGTEHTFGQLKNRAALQQLAHNTLLEAHKDMVSEGLLTSQVVLKLKQRSFHVRQYTKTISPPTEDPEVLLRALETLVLPLLDAYGEFRLLGVRFCKLITKAEWERQTQKQRQGTLSTFFSRAQTAEGLASAKRPRLEYSLSSSSRSVSSVRVTDEDEGNDDVVCVDDTAGSDTHCVDVCTPLGHDPSVEVLSPLPPQTPGQNQPTAESSQSSVVIVD